MWKLHEIFPFFYFFTARFFLKLLISIKIITLAEINIYSLSFPHSQKILRMAFTPFATFCMFVLDSYSPAVLQSYSPTVIQSYSPTIKHSYCPTVLPSYSPIVLYSHQGCRKSKIGWEMTKSGCHVRSLEL